MIMKLPQQAAEYPSEIRRSLTSTFCNELLRIARNSIPAAPLGGITGSRRQASGHKAKANQLIE